MGTKIKRINAKLRFSKGLLLPVVINDDAVFCGDHYFQHLAPVVVSSAEGKELQKCGFLLNLNAEA